MLIDELNIFYLESLSRIHQKVESIEAILKELSEMTKDEIVDQLLVIILTIIFGLHIPISNKEDINIEVLPAKPRYISQKAGSTIEAISISCC